MKKVLLLLLTASLFVTNLGYGADHTADALLEWMKLSPSVATQEEVTSLLGKPMKIEDSKKRTWWYYVNGNTNLTILWSNKPATLEKFSFICVAPERTAFDARLSRRLRSGSTSITQVVQLLGVPKDMTIKEVTQEMHYVYSNSVLRLFFRNRTLVDFTLQSHL